VEYTLARISSSDGSEASLRREQERAEEEARRKFNASLKKRPQMSAAEVKTAKWSSEDTDKERSDFRFKRMLKTE